MIEIRAKGQEHIQVEDRGKGAGLLIGYGEARVFLPAVELDHFIARLTNINDQWERKHKQECPRCEGSGCDPGDYLPEPCGDCGGSGWAN